MKILQLIIIVAITGFLCLLCISCVNSKTQTRSDNFVHAVGYFLETDENFFFVADGDSSMFTDKEFIKMFPVDETISFDGLSSGDKIAIDIETVGD